VLNGPAEITGDGKSGAKGSYSFSDPGGRGQCVEAELSPFSGDASHPNPRFTHGHAAPARAASARPAHLFRDSDDEAFWRSVTRGPADTVSGLTRLARMERRVTSPDAVLRARFREL
jgi:hypothetical protein